VAGAALKALPVTFGRPSGKPLGLGAWSQFRTVVDTADGNDFGATLEKLTGELTQLTGDLSASKQIIAALTSTVTHIASPLGTDPATLAAAIRFAPQGGSLSGLLRSLEPALHLGGPGLMPITRHGSTIEALLAVGEALAADGIDAMTTNDTASSEAVVVFDDFGDDLNDPAGQHLAATIRRAASQAWLSTRRAAVVTAFDPAEIVRLSRPGGVRAVSYGPKPVTRPERLAVRHFHIQLAPAMAATVVVVVEGPHDRATLATVQARRLAEHAIPLLAAHGIQLVDAAAADACGGVSGVERLAKLARNLGLRTVAVIDYDPARQAAAELAAVRASADVTIRLPEGYAVERLLLDGLGEDIIRATCIDVSVAFGTETPKNINTLTGSTLEKAVIKWLKGAGGMHSPFITALPDGLCPPAVARLLDAIVAAATDPMSPDYVQL
jgi:putative ATP-dependent endonuclease of OLD family